MSFRELVKFKTEAERHGEVPYSYALSLACQMERRERVATYAYTSNGYCTGKRHYTIMRVEAIAITLRTWSPVPRWHRSSSS